MRIAVMGAGGVGGYFGGLLARADQDVTFIARGAHLDAIRRGGLHVSSDLSGEFVVESSATDTPSAVGPVDLVLYGVKMYHNAEAIPAIAPLVGADTVVLTLQNGVTNGDELSAVLGRDPVMVGAAFVQARIREPGHVEQLGQVGRVVFGEPRQGVTARGRRLLEAFEAAGWNVELSENALGTLWRKFIYVTGSAGVNAVTQVPFGEMRSVPETRELLRSVYGEIVEVAKAQAASIGDEVVDWCMATLDGFPADGMTSLANDFRNANPVELEGLTGTVVRMARDSGVAAPVTNAIYALLRPAALRIEAARSHGPGAGS